MCEKSSTLPNVYTRNPKDMDFRGLEKLLRETANHVSLVRLSGGEPLHFREIEKLILLFDELNLKYAILTNGALLSERISRLLIKNCIQISFSIDSADPEIYSRIRYPGNIDLVAKNIKFLNRFKKDSNSKTPVLNLAVTTFSFNLKSLPGLVSFCSSHAIKSMSVGEGTSYNTPAISRGDLLENNIDDVSGPVSEAIRAAKKHKVILRFTSPVLIGNTKIKAKQVIKKCLNFYMYTVADPSLNIFACNSSEPIGNLAITSFSEIWNGENGGFAMAREQLSNEKLPATCRHCIVVAPET